MIAPKNLVSETSVEAQSPLAEGMVEPRAQAQARPLRILVADDGSEHSRAARQLLQDLPLPDGSLMLGLAVIQPRDAAAFGPRQAALKMAGEEMQRDGLQVETELVAGEPAETLMQFAEQFQPDLIVMGAKGLRATLGILLGGVAQQMVEYANFPVLVVRAPYHQLQRILLVTDGSEYSQQALLCMTGAREEVQTKDCPRFPFPAGADLRIVHVLPPLPLDDTLVETWPLAPEVLPPVQVATQEERRDWLKREEEEGQALLERTAARLQAAGYQPRTVLLRGDAATEIISYAKDEAIDLIVAGSRGLGAMKGWLLGSVSRKLVHYAGCSVLVVKGRTTELSE